MISSSGTLKVSVLKLNKVIATAKPLGTFKVIKSCSLNEYVLLRKVIQVLTYRKSKYTINKMMDARKKEGSVGILRYIPSSIKNNNTKNVLMALENSRRSVGCLMYEFPKKRPTMVTDKTPFPPSCSPRTYESNATVIRTKGDNDSE